MFATKHLQAISNKTEPATPDGLRGLPSAPRVGVDYLPPLFPRLWCRWCRFSAHHRGAPSWSGLLIDPGIRHCLTRLYNRGSLLGHFSPPAKFVGNKLATRRQATQRALFRVNSITRWVISTVASAFRPTGPKRFC